MIDVVTAPELQSALLSIVEGRPATVVVDLTETTFLSSAGLAVLATLAQEAEPDVAVRVVATGPVITRPITLTGLDQVFSLHTTRHDALSAS